MTDLFLKHLLTTIEKTIVVLTPDTRRNLLAEVKKENADNQKQGRKNQ